MRSMAVRRLLGVLLATALGAACATAGVGDNNDDGGSPDDVDATAGVDAPYMNPWYTPDTSVEIVDGSIIIPGIDANGVDVVHFFDSAPPPPTDSGMPPPPFDGSTSAGGQLCDPNNSTYQNIYAFLVAFGGYTTCHPDGTGCAAGVQCCMLQPQPPPPPPFPQLPNMCINK
jgi:hypothetical protein